MSATVTLSERCDVCGAIHNPALACTGCQERAKEERARIEREASALDMEELYRLLKVYDVNAFEEAAIVVFSGVIRGLQRAGVTDISNLKAESVIVLCKEVVK